MIRLLNKTSKVYAFYVFFTLLVSIPAYYYLINAIWLKDVDESLYFTRQKMQDQLNALPDSALEAHIAIINQVGIGITVHPRRAPVPKDSLYTIIRFDRYHGHQEPFRMLATQIILGQKPYDLLLGADLEESDELILPIVGIATLFLLLLLAGFILISRRLSSRIWYPFYMTLDQLRQFTLNRPRQVHFAPTDIYEFDQLHQILRTLIDRNLAVYQEQKEFTENASHELQTPLALLQTKVDRLFQSEALTHAQADLLEEAKKIIGRMSRLNKSLLLLSKIENNQFEQAGSLHLSQLLHSLVQQYAQPLESQQLTFEQQIQADVWVEANEQLAEIFFSNLLSNAIRHNYSGGTLHLTLTPEFFSLANSGLEQALEEHKLFKRFQHTGGSSQGIGLGLAIVKEISSRYSWQLTYGFEKNRHIFTIRF